MAALIVIGLCPVSLRGEAPGASAAQAAESPATSKPTAVSIGPSAPAGAVDIVREFFGATRDELRGIREGDRAAATAARKRLVDGVVGAQVMREQVRLRLPSAADEDLDKLIAKQVDGLQATVAYYLDGVNLEAVSWHPVQKGKLKGEYRAIEARVPAQSRGRSVEIAVMLAEVSENTWRVLAIGFAPPARDAPASSESRPAARQ